MEDIMPLQMSYKGDTQLESPISEGDIATLKRIFARQNDDVAVSLNPYSPRSLLLFRIHLVPYLVEEKCMHVSLTSTC